MTQRAKIPMLVLLGAFSLFASAALADLLVLRDGTTIETRGAVKLDNRRAVFTDLTGHLVALRIEEVDVARTTAPPAPPSPMSQPLSNQAPAAAKPKPPVLRLTDADVGHSVDFPADSAREAVPGPVVTLYSTSWCGWCRKSRQLMQSLGIAFVDKDVERDPQAAAEKSRLAPGSGVPVLVRGGQVVQGYDEAALRSWAPAVPSPKG